MCDETSFAEHSQHQSPLGVMSLISKPIDLFVRRGSGTSDTTGPGPGSSIEETLSKVPYSNTKLVDYLRYLGRRLRRVRYLRTSANHCFTLL